MLVLSKMCVKEKLGHSLVPPTHVAKSWLRHYFKLSDVLHILALTVAEELFQNLSVCDIDVKSLFCNTILYNTL